MASVHGVLAASPAPWLLVFDNAPDRASVAPFVPPAGPGRVLITSRNQIWPPGQALEVPVLDPQVAAEFLVGRTGDPDRRAALELAGELGGLPLALEQAAAYVQASGESLAGYLALFRQRRADLLGRGEPTGYPETVATTWRLAFEELQQAAPGAAGLLRLLAFCAPEAIPLRLLLQPRPGLAGQLGQEVAPVLVPLLEDELAAGDAIAALRRYSLISPPLTGWCRCTGWSRRSPPTRCPPSWRGAWRQAAAAVIEAALPADPEQPADLAGVRGAAAARPGSPRARPATAWPESPVSRRERQLCGGRDSPAAGPGAPAGEPRPRAPGDPHRPREPRPLDRAGGDAAAARDQFAALLPVMERVLGAEHPDTPDRSRQPGLLDRGGGGCGRGPGPVRRAAARSWSGSWARAPRHPGRPRRPRPLDRGGRGCGRGPGPVRRAAARCASGSPAPSTPRRSRARANLAHWTGEAGDAAAARDQFAALLPVRGAGLRRRAPEHPDRPRQPRPLDRARRGMRPRPGTSSPRCCPVRERVLGAEHPDTLTTRGNLARWTGAAGDAAAARDHVRRAAARRWNGSSAPSTPDTLTARGSLARWTGEAGDAAAARDQYAALLPVRERISGPEHPDTLTARGNLAYWTGAAGDAATARDHVRRAAAGAGAGLRP